MSTASVAPTIDNLAELAGSASDVFVRAEQIRAFVDVLERFDGDLSLNARTRRDAALSLLIEEVPRLVRLADTVAHGVSRAAEACQSPRDHDDSHRNGHVHGGGHAEGR